MKRFQYMDPEMIMTVVVSLIILGVGVFAFFVTIDSIPEAGPTPSATTTTTQNSTYWRQHNAVGNASNTGDSVFNIIGIVLIIGAIMTIVGLVYSYVRPGY